MAVGRVARNMAKDDSPCVRNCCINEEDICLGCFRSFDEILQWSASSEQQKQTVLDLTKVRRTEHRRRYPSLTSSDKE